MISVPVAIRSCTYWRIPTSGLRAGGSLQTLGVRITYENVSDRPFTRVTFLIRTGIHAEYVTDRGVFSPRVDITHQFYTTYVPYYGAKTGPDECRAVTAQ
jgi:hypothetical protein